ncbi:hypothetical protein OIDMADRAFT_149363 [Oidiodendron maius Zn]|uniref:Transcription factor domain-containing protein n=1 Tax=Oidiodendron maius (strain Zn) TaxID=913774 RepID=A0A0C3CYQ4_OIDMZ|nr:hypothetical protein OIDMADRAFT_149363 [Oidiodendron maius Zn]
MEHHNGTGHAPPLAYHFVRQSGRKIDESTRSGIRSHAMKEFRNRQRQQKQRRIVQSGQQSVIEKDLSLCRCLPRGQIPSASTEQYSGKSRDDLPLTSLESTSGYCYHCGKAQLLGFSQSQEMDIVQQCSIPTDTFAAADFDPFNSIADLPPPLTSKFSNEINAIKSHAITFCSPGAIKSIVFPEALRTPALLGSILYEAYSYLCSVRRWGSRELALGLKLAAISQINLKLSHPSTATCTNVIASVAYLTTGTWVFGDSFEEVETHLNGLEMMITQRGMESLGVYPFGQTIRKYLLAQHLLLAALQAQPATTTFDLDYSQALNADPVCGIKHVSPLRCPQKSFAQLLKYKGVSEDTVNLLYHAKALIDLMVNFDEGIIDELNFKIVLSNIKSELERHIFTREHQSAPDTDWVFDCCHLTVVIMLIAIEKGQPFASTDTVLTVGLVKALEKTDIGDNWGELSGVLYWVLMIGSASSHGRPGHRLLDSTLARTMSKLAFTTSDFGSAVEPVRQFSRLQMALKRRCQFVSSENPHN